MIGVDASVLLLLSGTALSIGVGLWACASQQRHRPFLLSLGRLRDTAKGVPDLLNWASLIDDGIVLNKDGSLLAGFFYRGPDQSSATAAERNYLTAQVNRALTRLGSGWVTWHEAVRVPADDYPSPEHSAFPDVITRSIDALRHASFAQSGRHFETSYLLVLMYTPPRLTQRKLTDMVYDDESATTTRGTASAERTLMQFMTALSNLEDSLSSVCALRRLGSDEDRLPDGTPILRDELVNFLHSCMRGEAVPLNLPAAPMYMDGWVGGVELWPGNMPKLGDKYISVISIEGLLPQSYPGVLDMLGQLPMSCRWSTRMIYLDAHEALGELARFRRKWQQKIRGLWSQVFRTEGGIVNEDALMMAQETEAAMNEVHDATVAYGYYTSVLVLMDPNPEQLEQDARQISRELQSLGFAPRIETLNTLEAWLGSLPGHPRFNIRRPLLHTLNLADMLPLTSVWAGHALHPNPLYPPSSPPLAMVATSGATPLRLNLHVGDVGHTLVFGPTGAGKSTLLAFIAAQFRRYRGGRITAFDKGGSLYPLVTAAGGLHADMGGATSPGLCPLAMLDNAGDLAWAGDWLETCYTLQSGQAATPIQRERIRQALLLSQADPKSRSLTEVVANLQDESLRTALTYYTLGGPLGHLLDAEQTTLDDNAFTVYELEELMGMGERNLIPVLLALFRRFERSLTGDPALLLLDEAWIMLGHPVFREKIREWLKVLRKANCAVVLATQSLSDAFRSGILDVLLESCPTRILLPNEEAEKSGSAQHPGPRDFYEGLGLNDVEIELIATSVKKRQYYYTSPEGKRLFELDLSPFELAFLGASSRKQIAAIRQLVIEFGEDWPARWIDRLGIDPGHLLKHKQASEANS